MLLEFLNMHSLVRRAKSEVHFYDKFYEKGEAELNFKFQFVIQF